MGTLASDLWPFVVTALISVFGTYFGAVHSLRTRVAVLEEKVMRLQERVESHSKKTDDILKTINGFKDEISKQLGQIAVDIVKINTTLNIVGKS